VAESFSASVRQFFEDLSENPVEEIVIEYVIREVGNGRKLSEVLDDPYVRNRLNGDRIDDVLANPEVIEAVEKSISTSFEKRDFGFAD
jgi:hypothetical protein